MAKDTSSPNPGAGIDYNLFLDCIHCGLCTAACPTYAELGDENDSPRGRIYLMRAVTDERLELTGEVRRHLELCLDCRACETACPSGVQYGRLIEPFRIAMEQSAEGDKKTDDRFHQKVLFRLFPYPKRMRRRMRFARLAQRLGAFGLMQRLGLTRMFSPPMRRLITMLPKLEKPQKQLPDVLPAKGKRRARVALFSGCIQDVMFRSTNWATARVLQENGCDVVVPKSQGCCGAIHFHAGISEPAREFADQNLEAFNVDDVDAVIINVAGCGSMLKEYGHHWQDEKQPDREKFANKVKDISEFLDDLGLVRPRGKLNLTATYHDACHLAHAQKVVDAPRNILRAIPSLKLVELRESELCCGAAGTYNRPDPEMSERLSRRKMKNILDTAARVVVTGNAGCLLQIAAEARKQGQMIKIVHPMDLLDLSYRGEQLKMT